MQPLHAPDQSVKGTPLVRNDPPSSGGEPVLDEEHFASRWEPDTLVARTTSTDPYASWLNERRFERYSVTGSTARSAPSRLRRDQPPKAPWEAIMVTLTPDG